MTINNQVSIRPGRKSERLRKLQKLPKRCECGGLMDYRFDMGRIWSSCLSCTPIIKVRPSRMIYPIRETLGRSR